MFQLIRAKLMKIFNYILYIIHSAFRLMSFDKSDALVLYYTRNYFSFVFASSVALIFTNTILRIDLYRNWLFTELSPSILCILGIIQFILTFYTIFIAIKKYYTNDKIKQVSDSYYGTLSPTFATIIYLLFFIVHLFLSINLLFPLIGLFVNKKITIKF